MRRPWFTASLRRLFLLLVLSLVIGIGSLLTLSVYQFKKMTHQWFEPLLHQEQARANDPIAYDHGSEAEMPRNQQPTNEQESKPILPYAADESVRPKPKPELPPKNKPLTPFTILLIGTDSRAGEMARSDVTMLAAVNPQRQSVYLLSIPRDSLMDLPGRGQDKLNHAMSFGGPLLVKKTLERYFSIAIDHYITVDFTAFRKIVDEFGGVEITVHKRMKYTDPADDTYINLYPGKQVLNGKQALDYVRYRKSDIGREDTDSERMKRQQEVIRALADKGFSWRTVIKTFRLMHILGQHIKTDLIEEQIASLLVAFYDQKQRVIDMEQLRGYDRQLWVNGVRRWFFLIDAGERNRIKQRIKAELASP